MSLEPGRMLAHYRLVEKIGEGGMGVVWKAVDTDLDREVAVKVLSEALSADAERMARFEREARLLASLSHPNIATVHGLHEGTTETGTVRFLAMELVAGRDLAAVLEHGPLPLEQALASGLQIAEALEAAHEQGVVHRDLKPANVQRTPGGTIKVLDFGLAKALAGEAAAGDATASLSPTVTSLGTVAGVILGTAAYMSPEQAHGRPVDRRADIWSFGCVLYEMLTGRRPFAGESVSDTLASVLKLEPDWSRLRGVPGPVRHLLGRCLTKDPRRRLQAIGEARIALEDALSGDDLSETPGAPAGPGPSPRPRVRPWALLLLAGAALAATWLWPGGARRPAPSPTRVAFDLGAGEDIRPESLALSPDGRRLAFVLADPAANQLWVRDLDGLGARRLPDTEGARTPFFSPDGAQIGFFAGNRLRSVPVDGGPVQALAEAVAPRGGTWCADGSIVYTPAVRGGLYRLRPGGEPEALTVIDRTASERTHRWPACAPDGTAVVFGVQYGAQDYHDGAIDLVDLETGARTTIHRGGSAPQILAGRYLTFARKGQLHVAPFDPEARKLLGRPEPRIRDLLSSTGNQAAADGSAQYAVSQAGHLVYRPGQNVGSTFPMLWVNRKGEESPAIEQPDTYIDPRISPDGSRIVLNRLAGNRNDLWIFNLESGSLHRFTFEDGTSYFPVWSPDGRHLAYTRDSLVGDSADVLLLTKDTQGTSQIYVKRTDGTGSPQLVMTDTRSADSVQRIATAVPCSWSPDGRILAISAVDEKGSTDIRLLHLKDDLRVEREEPFAASPFQERFCAFSPDGRWIAYQSDESGGAQIYVRPYPDTGGRWQISLQGGRYPRWTSGGREMVFRSGTAVMSVSVQEDGMGGLRFGRPERLFEGSYLDLWPFSSYDVAPDGERFVLFPGSADGDTGRGEAILVLDWLAELQAR